jgi:hypothetical protein
MVYFFFLWLHSLTHSHNTLTIYTSYTQVTLSLTHHILTYYYYLHALNARKWLHVLTLMATCSQATRLLTHTFSQHEQKKKNSELLHSLSFNNLVKQFISQI